MEEIRFHSLNELYKRLLPALKSKKKELIKDGLCWFPRLMRWKTSKGEVAPVFIEKSDGIVVKIMSGIIEEI